MKAISHWNVSFFLVQIQTFHITGRFQTQAKQHALIWVTDLMFFFFKILASQKKNDPFKPIIVEYSEYSTLIGRCEKMLLMNFVLCLEAHV